MCCARRSLHWHERGSEGGLMLSKVLMLRIGTGGATMVLMVYTNSRTHEHILCWVIELVMQQ
jgi:hypothetical protein